MENTSILTFNKRLVLSCELFKFVKKNFIIEHLRATASKNIGAKSKHNSLKMIGIAIYTKKEVPNIPPTEYILVFILL